MTHGLDSVVTRALDRGGLAYRRFRLLELVRHEVDADGRAVLVFLDDASQPALFLKLGTGRRQAELETEHANLEALWRNGGAAVQRGIPRPVALDRSGEFRVLAVEAIAGSRMKDFPPTAYFSSAGFGRHLDGVLDWWVEFHDAIGPSVADARPDAADQVAAFRRSYTRSKALDRLLDISVATLGGADCPPGPWHGDFCTANVLIDATDRPRVVDWELPLTGGWPLADVLYFASSVWCIPHAKGASAREANFLAGAFESSPVADRLNQAVRRVADRLELRAEWLLPLSVLSWVGYANRKAGWLGPAIGDDAAAAGHLPLVIVRRGRCRNLELLAEHAERYRLTER